MDKTTPYFNELFNFNNINIIYKSNADVFARCLLLYGRDYNVYKSR